MEVMEKPTQLNSYSCPAPELRTRKNNAEEVFAHHHPYHEEN